MLKHQFISSYITHKTIWLLSADWEVTVPTSAAATFPADDLSVVFLPADAIFNHHSLGHWKFKVTVLKRASWQPLADSVFSLKFFWLQGQCEPSALRRDFVQTALY